MHGWKASLLALGILAVAGACSEAGPFEEAGEAVDEAADDVGDAVDEATEDLDD